MILSVRGVSEDVQRALRVRAAETGETMGAIVERALRRELGMQEKQGQVRYALDIHEIVSTETEDGYTVSDHSVDWPLVETITGDTPQECERKAYAKYDTENYHWATPYEVRGC